MSKSLNQKKLLKIKTYSSLSKTDYTQLNNTNPQNVHFAEVNSSEPTTKRALNNHPLNKSINPKNLKNVNYCKKPNRNYSVKLPLLIKKNEDCSFFKMKKYTVPIPKIRRPKKINIIKIEENNTEKKEDDEDKKSVSEKSDEKEENKKSHQNDSSFKKSDDEQVMDFNQYLKMQSKAEARLRPRFGDTSLNLENYIKKVGIIRKQIMDNLMQELNSAENRYNREKPEVDSKFRTKEKLLIDNRWKNSFSLEEYQKFFSKNLKGKISSNNYRLMLKKFRQISLMCFAEGNLNLGAIKRLNYID